MFEKFNMQFVKDHWPWILGGGIGLYVVYRLYSGSTSSSTASGVSATGTITPAQEAQLITAQGTAQAQMVAASGQAVTNETLANSAMVQAVNAPVINTINQAGQYSTAVVDAAAATQINNQNAQTQNNVAFQQMIANEGGVASSAVSNVSSANASSAAAWGGIFNAFSGPGSTYAFA